MASSFEKSVKGATKIKAAPPKPKYIEHLLVATHSGEAGVAELFRALTPRLRDSTWTVVFKSLITVHMLIREGSPDVTLAYLAKHRNTLAISMFSDAQTQGRNIRHYANYLSERARAYRDTKVDWVRTRGGRLERLTVDKGLLRETEVVQHQLTALLKCDVLEHEPENEITLFVFRLLVLDLLQLYQTLNQGMINILGNFFEMSKPDAERALGIYHTFAKQTDFVVQFLSIARQYEHQTRVEVPKLKHAPVNLGRQLEDYVKDPDFDTNRRQYLAEGQAKKSGGAGGSSGLAKFKTETTSKATSSNKAFPEVPKAASQPAAKPTATKGPDPDLIDFFGSIEQNQTPMATQPTGQMQQPWPNNMPYQQQQQNGFAQPAFQQQQTNPFQQQNQAAFAQQPYQQQMPQQQPQQLQTQFTGAGFGGFTPQQSFQPGALGSIPQDGVASFQTGMPNNISSPVNGQQTTNPFRQSMMMTGQMTGQPQQMQQMQQQPMPQQMPQQMPQNGMSPSPIQPQSTNPFARSATQSPQTFSLQTNTSPFQSQLSGGVPQQQMPQQAAAPLMPQATGTNPFAKNYAPPQPQPQMPQQTAAAPLMPQATGTNPFRQGAFVNHQTGQGWQGNQQVMGGGLDHLETLPVFPRPATQTPWQQ